MYRFMLYFLTASAVFLAIAWPVYSQYLNARERTAIGRFQSLSDLNERLLQRQVSELYSDISVQAITPIVRRYLTSGTEADRAVIEAFFAQAAGVYRHYDQMRILDLEGNELLRISHRGGKSVVVPHAQLQNKADRYYFKQILRLQPGEIYISPIDLNMENGRVERPFVPTMRLGTKVTDQAGTVRGIILLNFNAADMLAEFQKSLKAYPLVRGMLLNQGGFWVSDPEKGREWAWQLGQPGRSFSARYPDFWYRMVTQPHGEIRTREGVYLFRRIDPFPRSPADTGQNKSIAHDGGDHWHGVMLMFIPKRTWLENSLLWQPPGQLSLVLIILLLAVASWIGAKFQVQKAAVRAERARHASAMER